MAEISDLRSRYHQPGFAGRAISDAHLESEQGGAEDFDLDFDQFSPEINSANPSFFEDYTSSFDLGFAGDNGCETEDSNFFFGSEDDEEEMNFVTDLFGSHLSSPSAAENPVFGSESVPIGEIPVQFEFETGLRVVDIDSESDSYEFEVNSGFIYDDEDDLHDAVEASEDDHRSNDIDVEEFEWEEVSDRIQFDDREYLNSVINRIEEISVYSDNSSIEEDAAAHVGDEQRTAEWEVLLAEMHLNPLEDFILSMEYNAFFHQLADNETTSKGSPPAAKSAVENLPWMVLTEKEVGEDRVVSCAVCKDEFAVGDKVTAMPCRHMYHGGCILPWLSLRNSCPVCRFELPTDDENYERRRGEQDGTTMSIADEFPTRYHFEVLPLQS